jgi:hypothetical protein
MKLELVSPKINGFSVDAIKGDEDSQPIVKKAKI